MAEADHIIRTGDTVRGTAKVFGVSKTTVHIDMTMRLPRIHSRKAKEVNKVLEFNFNEKHIRGGTALREKCKGGEKRVRGERVISQEVLEVGDNNGKINRLWKMIVGVYIVGIE